MAGEHACAVLGCDALAKPGQLMCYPHWKATPSALQHAVTTTWKRYRYDPEAYREARQAAVDHWIGRRLDSGRQGELL